MKPLKTSRMSMTSAQQAPTPHRSGRSDSATATTMTTARMGHRQGLLSQPFRREARIPAIPRMAAPTNRALVGRKTAKTGLGRP